MSEGGKIASAFGRRYLMSLALGLGISVVALFCCGGGMVVLSLASMVSEDLTGVLFFVGLGCTPFAAIALGIGGGLALRGWRLGPLRAAFAFVGKPGMYLLSGQRWNGAVDGRTVDVRYLRDGLWITVSGDPPALFKAGRDNALARAVRSDPLEIGGGVIVFPESGTLEEVTREALRRLLADDGRSLRSLEVRKGAAELMIRHASQPEIDRCAQAWVADLAKLVG